MSYSTLSPEIRETAERILTRKQLDVFKLWCGGKSLAESAIILERSEPTVAQHLRRAKQLMEIELRKDAA